MTNSLCKNCAYWTRKDAVIMPKGIITPLERKEALMAEFKRRPKAPFFSAKELGITIDSEALEEWRKHR